MSGPLGCPGFEYWQTLLEGEAPAGERERYERHLETCRDCQARLDTAEGQPEMLRRVAREVGDPTRAPCDPALARVLERLLEGKAAGGAAADLYFLRPAGRDGLLGTLGGYEVTGVIGQGGMGVVLKAYEPALNRLVAIKVMSPALAGSATARKRFTREAQAAAAVCHDHVVAVYGVHEDNGLPYLVMQYVAGESLQARLDRTGPLEVIEVVRIGMQTAQGLAAAHAQGLIHRDIKPANLLLENGLAKVKITDFGLARTADDIGLTQSGVVAGTPEYMAPEQAGARPIDHRADLFSLGSVMYAMCAGRPPFRGATSLAVLRSVCDEDSPAVRLLNPEVPAWLEQFIARLMAKDPAGRFQSAAEAAALLEGYLAHLRRPTAVPAPSLPPGDRGQPRRPARRRALWAVAALAGLLSVLGLAHGLLRQGASPAGQAPEQKVDGAAAAAAAPRAEYPEDFHPALKGSAGEVPGLVVFGPSAAECVKFEPEGLRITLPPNYPTQRDGTGVVTDFGVRGDFEVTVSFEILEEPPPWVSGNPTELRLVVVPNQRPRPGMWHRTNQNRAILSRVTRSLAGRFGVPGLFHADFTRWNNEDIPRDQWGNEILDRIEQHTHRRARAEAKAGRLRLVRGGPTLSCYVGDGPDGEFTLLHTADDFGTDDLKNVRVLASTGGPGASFDVRVTDMRVRAEALPKTPAAAAAPAAQPTTGRRWLFTVLALSGLSAAAAVSLGAWLYARRGRPAAPSAGKAPGAVVFACPGCGKRLRARAGHAGARVKCPQCGKGVVVPKGRPESAEEEEEQP